MSRSFLLRYTPDELQNALTRTLRYAIVISMSGLTPEPANPAAQRAERRLALLEEMAEIGMRLLRDLPDLVGETDAQRTAEAFARISRAVRLTLALEEKTDRFLAELAAGLAPAAGEEAAGGDHPWLNDVFWESQTRRRIEAEARIAEAIDAEVADETIAKSLYVALDERLADREACLRILDYPFREAVERLCKDLGFAPDWSRWEGDGWAADYARREPLWRTAVAVAPAVRGETASANGALPAPRPFHARE